jgi:hypothetical protein
MTFRLFLKQKKPDSVEESGFEKELPEIIYQAYCQPNVHMESSSNWTPFTF